MRVYKSGSKWAVWRWVQSPQMEGYMDRLHLIHTPWGGVMINWIRKPDRMGWAHDHPVDFVSFIVRGGYWELREGPGACRKIRGYASPCVRRMLGRLVRCGVVAPNEDTAELRSINRMTGSSAVRHCITRVLPNTTTLVVYGRRKRVWGYHTPDGWKSWRKG